MNIIKQLWGQNVLNLFHRSVICQLQMGYLLFKYVPGCFKVVKYVGKIKGEGYDLYLSNHRHLCRFSELIHGLEFELKTVRIFTAAENIDTENRCGVIVVFVLLSALNVTLILWSVSHINIFVLGSNMFILSWTWIGRHKNLQCFRTSCISDRKIVRNELHILVNCMVFIGVSLILKLNFFYGCYVSKLECIQIPLSLTLIYTILS